MESMWSPCGMWGESKDLPKCGARELNNVLAENQKILMTIIEKCGHRGLPNAEPEG